MKNLEEERENTGILEWIWKHPEARKEFLKKLENTKNPKSRTSI